jgi:hypothetical protein
VLFAIQLIGFRSVTRETAASQRLDLSTQGIDAV